MTIKEIAKHAGVSSATVSKALNNKPDIAISTRKRIQKIAKNMGYSVNMAARALAKAKTMAIGVVVAFPQIPTVIERLMGIQEAATQNGFQALMSFHNGSADNEIQQLQLFRGRVDGIILTPANHTGNQLKTVKSLALPMVLMSEPLLGLEKDYVGIDDFEGGRLAAVHLLEQNHRSIAYFACTKNTPSDKAIIIGIEEGFQAFGSCFDRSQIYWNNLTKKATQSNTENMLKSKEIPSAVFAFSDITALWVMDCLDFHGIRVPEDMAVVGFDNVELASLGGVAITSIAQPNYNIGYQATKVLLDRINSVNTNEHYRKVIFTPKLMVRESSMKTASLLRKG